MSVPLVFGVKLLNTLVARILKSSRKMKVFHMPKRMSSGYADLATQVALKLPNVFPFSDLARVSMQVLLNFSSVFPIFLHSTILHLQCSRIVHEDKINVKLLLLSLNGSNWVLSFVCGYFIG